MRYYLLHVIPTKPQGDETSGFVYDESGREIYTTQDYQAAKMYKAHMEEVQKYNVCKPVYTIFVAEEYKG